MRVTNTMLVNNFLRNLNTNLSRMEETQNKLSSGKRISRPSDDPVGLVYSLGLRSSLNGVEQYMQNTEDAISWLELTDSALESATNLLHRAKELAVYGAGGTLDKPSLEALAREIEQIAEEMRQVANSNLAGRYLFAGNKTGEPPFPPANEQGEFIYHGNATQRKVEIGVDIVIPFSVTGDRAFGDADILGTLSRLQGALGGTGAEKPGDILGDLDNALDHILSIRAEVGARLNRLDLVQNRLETSHLNFTELLSKAEDADLAETVIDLKNQENIYRASLSAGARIIQPSLVDFLR